jgi:hypothetical protein
VANSYEHGNELQDYIKGRTEPRGRVVGIPASHSEGARFKSGLGNRLSSISLFVVFLSPLGKCRDSTSN